MLFKMEKFHDLIHYFRWPKKDFLSLLELSETFIFVLTATAERYQYESLLNQSSMAKQ